MNKKIFDIFIDHFNTQIIQTTFHELSINLKIQRIKKIASIQCGEQKMRKKKN